MISLARQSNLVNPVTVHGARRLQASANAALRQWRTREHELKPYNDNASRSISALALPPRTVFSGIQPTGTPHLGNLLGALLPWVNLQNEAPPQTRLLFSIVDLHSLTSSTPADDRISNRRNLLAAFLAAGLDPKKCTIFYQSAVPQHAELHWILSCTSSMSTLARMTQWKTKLAEGNQDLEHVVKAKGKESAGVDEELALLTQAPNPRNVERLKLGLFSYPVLQAADILVHRATQVPVGEDQRQHVEFARTCAGVFNHHYHDSEKYGSDVNEVLTPPEILISPARRIMSLSDPTSKMSKSTSTPKSLILLTDSDDMIRKKLRAALTDSSDGITHDRQSRPGVSNLIDIIAHSETREIGDVVKDVQGSTLGGLKDKAASAVIALVSPIRAEFERLTGERDGRALDDIAEEGAIRAMESAESTMKTVREVVGIGPG